MSIARRGEIETTVKRLVGLIDGDKKLTNQEREIMHTTFGLAAGALADLNRIADANEVMASPIVIEAGQWTDATGRAWRVLATHTTPAGKTWGLVADPDDVEDVSIMERPA